MVYIDNMGGFVSAKFILHSDVEFIVPSSAENECSLQQSKSGSWQNLRHKTNGIGIQVTSEVTKAGTLYKISGSIILKKDCESLPTLRIRHYILLAAVDTDGKTRLFGTDEYPLESTLTPLTPQTPEGFTGYRLDFTGSQLFEPPFLKQE